MPKKEKEAIRITLPREWALFLVKLLIFGFLSYLVVQAGQSLRKSRKEQVAATVDGFKIFRSELEALLMKRFCKQSLEKLIEQKMISLLAERKNIVVTNEEIDEEIQKIKRGYGTEELFRRDYEKRGWTIEDVRSWVREQLLIEKLILNATSERELRDYFQSHKAQYDQERGALTRMIIVKSREKLRKVQKELASGKAFDEVAKEYSEHTESARVGGLLGWVTPTNVDPSFWQIISSAKLARPTEPFANPSGYHIFYVERRRPAKQATFEEARERVEQDYVAEKKANWLQKQKKLFKIKKFICKDKLKSGVRS